MAIGAIASYAVPALASLAGGSMSNSANASINERNINRMDLWRSTAYQTAVQDMEKAGLNPMLAYSQGGASAPSLSASAQMADVVSPAVNSGSAGYQAFQQVEQSKAATSNIKATTDKTKADTEKVSADTENTMVDTQLKQGQMLLQAAEYNLTHSKISLNQQQIELYKRQVLNAVLTGRKIVADTGNVQVDTLLKSLDINESKAYSDLYGTDAGHALPVLNVLTKHGNSAARSGHILKSYKPVDKGD